MLIKNKQELDQKMEAATKSKRLPEYGENPTKQKLSKEEINRIRQRAFVPQKQPPSVLANEMNYEHVENKTRATGSSTSKVTLKPFNLKLSK